MKAKVTVTVQIVIVSDLKELFPCALKILQSPAMRSALFFVLLVGELLHSNSFHIGSSRFLRSPILSMNEEFDAAPRSSSESAAFVGRSRSDFANSCKIKVIGVGGGGCNAVNRMIDSTSVFDGVDMWSINTDAQAIARGRTKNNLSIGKSTSRGLGAGGDPRIGAMAAEESREDISGIVKDTDLVFVTAGMGGGTGSGAAPIVAECAKEQGALTVGVVTKPFAFEGRNRMLQARAAISEMKDKVDTLIVVSNDRLLQIVPEGTPLTDAFLVADDILRQGVVGISEIIVKPGLVNVDFADVRSIMGNAGTTLMASVLEKEKSQQMLL